MEYQKIINLLDNTSNQPSKFRIKNWFKMIIHVECLTVKLAMLKSSLCDYSDAYILVKRTVIATDADTINADKEIFKNCAPFTECISKINNTQIDNAKDIDVVMIMYI